MSRVLVAAIVAIALAGCITTADQNRAFQPLPTEGAPLAYKDVIARARALATAATEAFYIDQWPDVVKAATSLEETGQYLPRSAEVPPARKASLDARSDELVKEAQALRDAAKAKDEKKTNASMQKINLLVRELRPE